MVTYGTGHIKFWEMAKTFTGLKLQGKVGKFGEIDISDIWDFVEYPSGKILTGSEEGNLLMWQNDSIQFMCKTQDNKKCHKNNIIYVDRINNNNIISADINGNIKIWEYNTDIEYFELSDDLNYFPLNLINEININNFNDNKTSMLVSIIKNIDKYWLIQDGFGSLWQMNYNDYDIKSVLNFHGKYVTGIHGGSKSHTIVTTGKDGAIVNWDLKSKSVISSKQLINNVSINLSLAIPNNNGYYILFCDDGIVRIVQQTYNKFIVTFNIKMHNEPIHHGCISQNGQFLVTTTKNQCFFSEIHVKLEYIL